eukprot:TRINITY_DN19678_c0_g2_i2.p1 TRINITY_DN19678_c0_g2~~TRINITY_DN19678_c0_g2_i2.p1  ORF type:complete len:1842 (-),score=367.51 TRINITY_DN19678_c0_g2_i2:61-4833(-)
MAAESGNSSLLHALLSAAPLALVVEAEDGSSLLENIFVMDALILDALADAALNCLAIAPESTVRMLLRNERALSVWRQVAQARREIVLLQACAIGDVRKTRERLEQDAELEEGEAGARMRQAARRLSVLRSLRLDLDAGAEKCEPEELRLRALHAEASAKEAAEEAAKRIEGLEEQLRQLRRLCKQQGDELLALRAEPTPLLRAGAATEPATSRSAPRSKGGSDGSQETASAMVGESQGERLDRQLREREVIEDIRAMRVVGQDPSLLDPALRAGVAEMRNSLAAAVDTIARDLYESEAHFMQELLQNADDNQYDPSVIPEISFSLVQQGSQYYFLAVNNEVGFSETDVRAITDISRSSKTRDSGETTGYKGVGWKSVFRVCKSPVVLSNGWRFKFNAEGLGFLTPEWVHDSEYDELPADAIHEHQAGKTVFVLPLQDVRTAVSIEEEMRRMESEPTGILFLRRVRNVRLGSVLKRQVFLSSTNNGRTACVSTADAGQPLQLFSKTDFEISKNDDVTVALPLVDEPPPQRIFAVLPVRAVGMHFAVNAPFHLTTSRSDLHHSARNAERRNAIAPAFLAACQNNDQVAARALKYLGSAPAEPFWFAVRDEIVRGLQKVQCVLGEDGRGVEPQRCILRGDCPAAKWVSADLLESATGCVFACSSNPNDLLRELGVRNFEFHDLVACLRTDGTSRWLEKQWSDTATRSAFFSDLYASLADGLRQNWVRLEEMQTLSIFPLSGTDALVLGTADKLWSSPCLNLPLDWQTPLLHIINTALELSAPAWSLLQMLGVTAATEQELERLSLNQVLSIKSNCVEKLGPSTWAALAVLRNCYLMQREPPIPWSELRGSFLLPSTTFRWLPPERLRPWSFVGIRARLPPIVISRVRVFVGLDALPSDSRSTEIGECVRIPDLPRYGSDWDLGWEAFLCAMGCAPIDPASSLAEATIEATTQLGDVLSAGQFLCRVAKSPPLLEYLELIVGPSAPAGRLRWLRKLPVRLSSWKASLEDLFLREAFHGLCGEHLRYVTGVPADARIRALLRRFGVAVEQNRGTLLKCLRQLKAGGVEDTSSIADVYAELRKAGCEGFGEERLIFVPGRGFLHAEDCCWRSFENPLLQRCCRVAALSGCYGRFGDRVSCALQAWVRDRAESDAGEVCDALIQAVRAARGDTGQGVPALEARAELLEASRVALRSLAALCVGSDDARSKARSDENAAVTFDKFSRWRLIVVSEAVGQCRTLHIGEAFWSVEPELAQDAVAALALERHYDEPQIKRFFIEVLRVKPFLSRALLASMRAFAPDDLDFDDLDVAEGDAGFSEGLNVHITMEPSIELEPFDPDRAIRDAFDRARRGGSMPELPVPSLPPQLAAPKQPRDWRQTGFLGPFQIVAADGARPPDDFQPDMTVHALLRVCSAFGLDAGRVSLAFDAGGRCVSEEQQLHLDLAQGRRIAHQHQRGAMNATALTNFWVTELAHALAHLGAGPAHDENFFQVHAEIIAHMSAAVASTAGPAQQWQQQQQPYAGQAQHAPQRGWQAQQQYAQGHRQQHQQQPYFEDWNGFGGGAGAGAGGCYGHGCGNGYAGGGSGSWGAANGGWRG